MFILLININTLSHIQTCLKEIKKEMTKSVRMDLKNSQLGKFLFIIFTEKNICGRYIKFTQ